LEDIQFLIQKHSIAPAESETEVKDDADVISEEDTEK
jgi:hypothetical protein